MAVVDTAFSVMSFLTFVLVSIPFSWHMQAWSTGTCLYMAWTALANLIYFVNSMVWRGNTTNWAPVWCDISTKIMIGIPIALPAASLCINRKLYNIASIRTVIVTKADKRRDIIIDLAIGLGAPITVMSLHYIVQGHRFDIFENYGCFPFTYNTPIAYLIIQAPVVILNVISGVFSIMSIVMFKRRQLELQILLLSTNVITPNRYLRLMCLAGIEVVLSLPISLAGIVFSAVNGDVQPWISWDNTHFLFSRVPQYPASFWRSTFMATFALELTRWNVVVCGLLFFAFFGFAEEARKKYRILYVYLARHLGFEVSLDGVSGWGVGPDGLGCLPPVGSKERAYVHGNELPRRSPAGSFSSVMSLQDVGGLLDYPASTTVASSPSILRPTPPLQLKPNQQKAVAVEDDPDLPSLKDAGGLLNASRTTLSPASPATSKGIPLDETHASLQDHSRFLLEDFLPESQSPTAVSTPVTKPPNKLQSAPFEDEDMDMPFLQDLSGFLQSNPVLVAGSQLLAAPPGSYSITPEIHALSPSSPHAPGSLHSHSHSSSSSSSYASASSMPSRPSLSTPNINTPPVYRPHSFPASVASSILFSPPSQALPPIPSPQIQIVVLPPPEAHLGITPTSGASSASMYSTSTAPDSPPPALFPTPVVISRPLPLVPRARAMGGPSVRVQAETLGPRRLASRGHGRSGSFLEMTDSRRSRSFLDFDDLPSPPPTIINNRWLAP